eukprot:520807_1
MKIYYIKSIKWIKKINIIKSKQIKINDCGEQQIAIMEQLKTEHNQIEEALLSQSISMQSIKTKIHSNAGTLTSINSQLKSLTNTHITSIQQSLQSLQSELLSFTNNKYDVSEHKSSQTAINIVCPSSKILSNEPTPKFEFKFTDTYKTLDPPASTSVGSKTANKYKSYNE